MKLTDVARASIAELQSDYFNWILSRGQSPWSTKEQSVSELNRVKLDYATYKDDVVAGVNSGAAQPTPRVMEQGESKRSKSDPKQ